MKLLNKIFFVHKKLNSVISQLLLNERINDWYELDKNNYFEIINDLGFISSALKENAFITVSKLFDDRDPNSINVQKITANIKSTKVFKERDKQSNALEISTRIDGYIRTYQSLVDNLQTWRDKYLAHFDKTILNNPHKIQTATISLNDVISLCNAIFTEINYLIVLFDEKKIKQTFEVYGNSIDTLFFRYLAGLDILYGENGKLGYYLHKINFPKSEKDD